MDPFGTPQSQQLQAQLHSPGIDPSADHTTTNTTLDWDTKKYREEIARHKNKLVDQKFNMSNQPRPYFDAMDMDPAAPSGRSVEECQSFVVNTPAQQQQQQQQGQAAIASIPHPFSFNPQAGNFMPQQQLQGQAAITCPFPAMQPSYGTSLPPHYYRQQPQGLAPVTPFPAQSLQDPQPQQHQQKHQQGQGGGSRHGGGGRCGRGGRGGRRGRGKSVSRGGKGGQSQDGQAAQADKRFKIADYPDPLAPAEEWNTGSFRQAWPVLPSDELARLRAQLEKSKAANEAENKV